MAGKEGVNYTVSNNMSCGDFYDHEAWDRAHAQWEMQKQEVLNSAHPNAIEQVELVQKAEIIVNENIE